MSNTEKDQEIAAAKAGMDPTTARRYLRLERLPSELKKERLWRTREDPFGEVWGAVQKQIEESPGLEAKTLFEWLQREHPGRFSDGQIRTLQRRIKLWRVLYLEFTHSQSFETFVRCHMHAFVAFDGVAREIVYDNLATTVAEHDGRLVRFLPRFLAFAREYGFYPRACNPAAGWEKGKVERAIGYARQSFWPLREFTDLHDVNRQARQWLAEVANQRQQRETRQRPWSVFNLPR